MDSEFLNTIYDILAQNENLKNIKGFLFTMKIPL